jgi:hypothetical protein
VAVVADWYGQQAALTGVVTLGGAGSGGVLLTSGGFSSIPSRLFVGGIAVALLAGLGTRVVIRWWHRPYCDHERVVLSTTCGVVSAVMIAALFQVEVAVTPRFVDVLAHATGMFAGLGLTALYSVGGE